MLTQDRFERLPLPLARLCRRAVSAKTAMERHNTAYCVWAACIKLQATAVVSEFISRHESSPASREVLQKLAHPELKHWLFILRNLLPELLRQGSAEFDGSEENIERGFKEQAAIAEFAQNSTLLSRNLEDLPRCYNLYSRLAALNEKGTRPAEEVKVNDLLDQIAEYDSRVFGSSGRRHESGETYTNLADSFISGFDELLQYMDPLAGHRLIYILDIRDLGSQNLAVARYDLSDESARRMPTLEINGELISRLPEPGQVYLDLPVSMGMESTSSFDSIHSVHPLILYDPRADRTYFLNARPHQAGVEYLCYSSGEIVPGDKLEGAHRRLMERLLQTDLSESEIDDWASAVEPAPSQEPVRTSQRRKIGEFELLTRIGRGGMGVVYRVWQPSLCREVALKTLIRTGDAKAEARFSREIRALGAVDHAHLIKVFTSGTEGDDWFYTMELVDGADLGDVSDCLAGLDTPARQISQPHWQDAVETCRRNARMKEVLLDEDFDLDKRLGPSRLSSKTDGESDFYVRQIVLLMRQVTEAIGALHEAGVIHRDIKPNNIMVTRDGEHAVLMDLGLARVKDDDRSGLTTTRQFVGTLRYASPEQVLAVGGISQASDVYSLGATLWELLSLRPLYGAEDDSSTLGLMHKIEYKDPAPTRKFNSAVPHDLDAIVGKCLEKSPERRYGSAQELLDDLDRFLEGSPVLARPLGRLAKWGRKVKRHPIGASLAAVTLIALITLGALLLNHRILLRERQFREELEVANQRADENFERAVNALDGVLALLTEGNFRKRSDLAPLRQKLLDYYDDYVSSYEQTGLPDLSLGQMYERLARITTSLGDKNATRNYTSALHVYESLASGQPESDSLRSAAGNIRNERGYLLFEEGDYDAAEADFDTAQKTFAELVRSHPDRLDYWRSLANAHHNLGELLEALRRHDDSLQEYQQALRIRRDELVAKSDDRIYGRDLGRSHGYLGDIQLELGDYTGALESYQKSVKIRGEVADSDPSDHEARYQLARAYRNLGHIRQLQRDLPKAIAWYRKSTEEDRRLVDEEPLVSDYRSDLGRYTNDLVELMLDHTDPINGESLIAEAEVRAAEASAANLELAKRNSNDELAIAEVSRSHVNLARLLEEKDPEQALSELKMAKQQFQRLGQTSSLDLFNQGVAEVLTARIMRRSKVVTRGSDSVAAHIRAATDYLTRAVQGNYHTIQPRISRCRLFDEIRNTPEFESVISYRGIRLSDEVDSEEHRSFFGVAVGVSDYVDPNLDLNYPDDDARSLAGVFRGQRSLFDKNLDVRELIDQQATRSGILNTIAKLRENSQAADSCLFVVSFSGHGRLHAGGDYFFLPHDFDESSAISTTGVSWDDLLNEFELIPGVVIVLLDTCHAGAAETPGRKEMEGAIGKLAERIENSTSRGVAVLASSLSTEASQERSEWEHGALSLAVLEALRGEHLFTGRTRTAVPQAQDQSISLHQLIDYAVRRVDELTDREQHVAVRYPNISPLDVTLAVSKK